MSATNTTTVIWVTPQKTWVFKPGHIVYIPPDVRAALALP